MKVYLFLLFVTIVSLTIYKRTGRKLFSVIPYIAMAFISGFRNGVGVDYDVYKYWFYDILDKKGWYSNTELGYKLLTEGVAKIGGNYQFVFLVMAVLTTYCYYQFIKEHSSNFVLSTMIYMCFGIFYFSSFNGTRQAMATALFLYALKFIDIEEGKAKKKDKWGLLKYILVIVVATLFHTSSFVFILFPLVVKRIGNQHLLHFVMVTVGGTLFISLGILDALLFWFFPVYYRYANYNSTVSNGYLLFLMAGILVLLLCSRLKVTVKPYFLHLLVFSVSLIAIMYLAGKYEMFLSRYASWGLPAIIILIPSLAQTIKQKKVYNALVYTVCLSYFFAVTLRGPMMLPYAFNFDIFENRSLSAEVRDVFLVET